MAEGGKFAIALDQSSGKPKSIPVWGSLDWKSLQGQWTVQNKKHLQEDIKFTGTADCTTYHQASLAMKVRLNYMVEAIVHIEKGEPIALIAGVFFRVNSKNLKKDAKVT